MNNESDVLSGLMVLPMCSLFPPNEDVYNPDHGLTIVVLNALFRSLVY